MGVELEQGLKEGEHDGLQVFFDAVDVAVRPDVVSLLQKCRVKEGGKKSREVGSLYSGERRCSSVLFGGGYTQ